MKTKYRVIISVLSIMLVTVVSIFSYAYLRREETQTGPNTFSTLECLDISLSADTFTLVNLIPISDSDGLLQSPYTFSVTNNCSTAITVDLNLEYLAISTISASNMKLAYNLAGDEEHQLIKLISGLTNYTETILNSGYTSKNITKVFVKGNETKSFELRIWIDNAATWEQAGEGKTFEAKISAIGKPVATGAEIASDAAKPESWNQMASNTLLNRMYNDENNYFTTTPLTKPGNVSAFGEATLTAAEDDYGITYYYRGSIENNFVVFANMCWRIVRVDGNNNIKLVLYNYNPNNLENPCNQTGSTLAFARTSATSSYTSAFTTIKTYRATNISFMHANDEHLAIASSSLYTNLERFAAEHSHDIDSSILTYLKKWLVYVGLNKEDDTNPEGQYFSDLYDANWCNDISISSGFGYQNIETYYSASNRISKTSFTFKCAPTGNDTQKSLSLYNSSETNIKAGLLTADEVFFAGGSNNANENVYLYNNANTTWWLLTPLGCHSIVNCRSYIYQFSNGITVQTCDDYRMAVRPSIVLNSNITVTTTSANNPGTVTNPYIVD